MNWSRCQIFTPQETVQKMLDEVEYNENIFGKRIIDNSCGNGNFLVEVVNRFIQDGIKIGESAKNIKHNLQSCITGIEIDERYYKECIKNLDQVADNYDIENVEWNVLCSDGLEYAEDNAFDYVVGNPPYVAYKDLSVELREYAKNKFSSCKLGKFDYSYAFIEKGLNLLNSNGKMVFISPTNMFKTVFGKGLREYIKPYLLKVIDCSSMNIFGNVLTSPVISVYAKHSLSQILVYHEMTINGGTEKVIDKSSLIDKWDFTGFNAQGFRRFGDDFKVSNSIATLRNSSFIKKTDENDNVFEIEGQLENNCLKTAISPRSKRCGFKQKIIFPYYYVQGELNHYSEDAFRLNFPIIYEHLDAQKKELKARDTDKNAKWFEYGRSQALAHLNKSKLLMSSIVTKKVVLYKLSEEEIPYSGLYIIPTINSSKSLDTAIEILKTRNFYQYLLSIGIKVSGESIRILSKDIEEYRY